MSNKPMIVRTILKPLTSRSEQPQDADRPPTPAGPLPPGKLALAFYQRARSFCDRRAATGGPAPLVLLVPQLELVADAWTRGQGHWRGTPGTGERTDFRASPILAVTDNGPLSRAIVLFEVRQLDRKTYRGTRASISPKMAEVRIWRFDDCDGGIAPGVLKATCPYNVAAKGMVRALPPGGQDYMGAAAEFIVALSQDRGRKWETIEGLSVPSSSGGPLGDARGGPWDPAASRAAGVVEFVNLIFDPEGSR
jgi:hypothetical protein